MPNLPRRRVLWGLIGFVGMLMVVGTSASAAAAASQTFSAVADSYTNSANPTTSYGAGTRMYVKYGSPAEHVYVKFNVSLPAGAAVTGATLKLYSGSGTTPTGVLVDGVANNSWTESGITYGNAPALGAQIGSSGGWSTGLQYISTTLPASYVQNGALSVGVVRPNTSSEIGFWTRNQGAQYAPLLVVTYTVSTRVVVPPQRFMFMDGTGASAKYGLNLADVDTKAEADALPAGVKAQMWVGGANLGWNNTTCAWDVSNAALIARVQADAGDPKIAGYMMSDEPNPFTCPNAPAAHKARTALIHQYADPSQYVLFVMDSNRPDSVSQVPLWTGTADHIGLNVYACHTWDAVCEYSQIDDMIAAADKAGMNYWGFVGVFQADDWRWPTTDELQHMLNQWGASHETGMGIFTWHWTSPAGVTTDLQTQPALLGVLQTFFTGSRLPPPPDTTPPSQPTGFAAGTATQTSIPTTWTASTDNVGVTGYDAYLNNTKVGSPAATSFTFSGLTCGTSYTLAVDAFDAAGNKSSQATTTASTAACSPPPPGSPHIMEIVMENHGAGAIIGNANAPFQNSLASNYITLTNWTGVDHPSSPNYVAMVTGQDNGVAGVGDCSPAIGSSCNWPGDNLGNQMFAAGVPAQWFAEDLSGNGCSISNSESANDVNHEPWAYMDRWQQTPGACAEAGLTTASPADASVLNAIKSATPPSYVWVTPNLTDDTHDGTIAQGDTYLKNLVTAVQATSWYTSGGTIIVTYDEDEGESNPAGYCTSPVIIPAVGNHCIPTFIVSAKDANVGAVSTPGDHYGMLRSLEECYGLPLLNNAATTTYGDLKSRLCG